MGPKGRVTDNQKGASDDLQGSLKFRQLQVHPPSALAYPCDVTTIPASVEATLAALHTSPRNPNVEILDEASQDSVLRRFAG